MLETEKLKTCKVCKQSKSSVNFYPSKSTKDLLGVYCKQCTIENSKWRINMLRKDPESLFQLRLNNASYQSKYWRKLRNK